MAVGQHAVCAGKSYANMDSPTGGRVHSCAKNGKVHRVGKSIIQMLLREASNDSGRSSAL